MIPAPVANLLVRALRRTGVTPAQWNDGLQHVRRVRGLFARLAFAFDPCTCATCHARGRAPVASLVPLGVTFRGAARGLRVVLDAAELRVCTVCCTARPSGLCVRWSHTYTTDGGTMTLQSSTCPNCALRCVGGGAA